MLLTHLTFVGPSVDPESVDFDASLTVTHGPSDTGKSYIADSINFVLGGAVPRQIPEVASFPSVLLGLLLTDGTSVTLERSLSGGAVRLYEGYLDGFPATAPSRVLAGKHDPRSEANISRYLLQQIGLDEMRIRKNARNETNMLSFRNLALLCIVDEERMQSRTSPFLSGQYVTRTAERSVLKLLLEGEDDSALREVGDSDRERNIGRGRQEMLDRAISTLQSPLANSIDGGETAQQLERLNASLSEALRNVEDTVAARDGILAARAGISEDLAKIRQRISEVSELSARFALLNDQYDSDLRRLDMIQEAGTFLGYFTPGVCVFCGADIEHQDKNVHLVSETTSFEEAVLAEISRTTDLRLDLHVTLADLDAQLATLRADHDSHVERLDSATEELHQLEDNLRPGRAVVQELLGKRSELERTLSILEQVRTLNALRGTLEIVAAPKRVESEGPTIRTVSEYTAIVREILQAWGVPESDRVDFDMGSFDVTINSQQRAARGKGMRSILHAATTIALMQYCQERELPHPGFVVLDSPLVTYRQPDVLPEDEAVDESVAMSFFEYLEREHVGQVVVLENTDPPALKRGLSIHFTKNSAIGRYGLFNA